MLPVAYYSVCLHKRDHEWARDLHKSAQEFATVTSPQIRKTVMCEPWIRRIFYIYKSDLYVCSKLIHLDSFRFEIELLYCNSFDRYDNHPVNNFIQARLQETVAAGWLLYLPTQQIPFCPQSKESCLCSSFPLRYIHIFKYYSQETFTIKDEMVHLKGIWACVVYSRYADIRLKEYFAQRDHFLSLTVEDLW